jgi:hypothetical protein
MTISRTRFDILTDASGDFIDTGPPMMGLITQVAYVKGTLTASTDFKLECINSGVKVLDWNADGANNWSRIPKVEAYDTGGSPTGETSFFTIAGDRLRLTVNQSATDTGLKSGTLYVWCGE